VHRWWDDRDDDDGGGGGGDTWEPNIVFYIQGTETQRKSQLYYYYWDI
jgi:hypothetical protein